MEILDLGSLDQVWDLIQVNEISVRTLPLICPINETDLLIMGGTYRTEDGKSHGRGDVFQFSTETRCAEPLTNSGIACFTWGPTVYQSENKNILSLVTGGGSIVRMIKFSTKTNRVTVLENLGKEE